MTTTSRIASVEQTVNALSAKMASFAAMEQSVSTLTENLSSLTARICKIETNATSLSGSDSPRSWNILGHSNGSTAAGSLGSHRPGSSDDSRNTRRRLDKFPSPEDEQARSAVLLRSFCEQDHEGTTKWINNLWEESNLPAFNNLVRIIVKQDLCRSGLYLKHEPNVKTLLLERRMMVSLMQLTVPSAAPVQLSLSASPNQLKTERLENNLRLCGENWLKNSKSSFLRKITTVHSSSQHSVLAHMSSASKIAETGLENQCSNLLLLEIDQRSPLLHLICLFLVFRLRKNNGSCLKPTRSMCDGRLFASSPFCRLASRGAPFRGFPFRWSLHFVLSLTCSVIVHDATSCSSADSLSECDRTCEALSCLFFSALWLQNNYSIMVQENQSVKDPDLAGFTSFSFNAVTCLQVGLMSLDWHVHPFSSFDHSRSSLSPDVPSDEQQRGALPASARSRWRQNALQVPPKILQRTTGWDGCGPFLSEGMRCVTWNTRGLDGCSPNRTTESSNSNISRSTLTPTTSYVSRRCMARTSSFRLFRCWLLNFVYMVLLLLTMKMREDRLSAFIGTFYLTRLW